MDAERLFTLQQENEQLRKTVKSYSDRLRERDMAEAARKIDAAAVTPNLPLKFAQEGAERDMADQEYIEQTLVPLAWSAHYDEIGWPAKHPRLFKDDPGDEPVPVLFPQGWNAPRAAYASRGLTPDGAHLVAAPESEPAEVAAPLPDWMKRKRGV